MLWLWLLVGCHSPCGETGVACTLVGDGTAGFNGDGGSARDALLYFPMDVTAQPNTQAYMIVDWNNQRIRRVDAEGVITTVVGTNDSGDGSPGQGDRTDPGAPGTIISLNHPTQVEFAPDGQMYIAAWHNHKVRRWDPQTGLVRVVVANHDQETGNNGGFDGDGGLAEAAHIHFPNSIAFDAEGNYYLVDEVNLRIRRVDPSGTIDTVLGCGDPGHGDGLALDATFLFPDSLDNTQPLPGGAVEIDADQGVMWIADTGNGVVRRWVIGASEVQTVPITGLMTPTDIELGPDGRLYLADPAAHVVFAVDPEGGEAEVVAGTGVAGDGEDGLPATETALDSPWGIDFTDDGTLLIADTFNSRIREVAP